MISDACFEFVNEINRYLDDDSGYEGPVREWIIRLRDDAVRLQSVLQTAPYSQSDFDDPSVLRFRVSQIVAPSRCLSIDEILDELQLRTVEIDREETRALVAAVLKGPDWYALPNPNELGSTRYCLALGFGRGLPRAPRIRTRSGRDRSETC